MLHLMVWFTHDLITLNGLRSNIDFTVVLFFFFVDILFHVSCKIKDYHNGTMEKFTAISVSKSMCVNTMEYIPHIEAASASVMEPGEQAEHAVRPL